MDFMQPGDAMGEDAGLAGTGAGEHEHVAGFGRDRLALRGVQAVEQVGNIHRGILGHRIANPDFPGEAFRRAELAPLRPG